MFSNESSSSISFAIVTPSFVISGAPKDLSRTTFLPFGPNVTFTVFANWFTPASRAVLASAPYFISFAILITSKIIQRLQEYLTVLQLYILHHLI